MRSIPADKLKNLIAIESCHKIHELNYEAAQISYSKVLRSLRNARTTLSVRSSSFASVPFLKAAQKSRLLGLSEKNVIHKINSAYRIGGYRNSEEVAELFRTVEALVKQMVGTRGQPVIWPFQKRNFRES